MSTHIKMADEYSEVTTYYGVLDDDYHFMIEVSYNSTVGNYNITSIEFIGRPDWKTDIAPKTYWIKAEDKIKDFVMKWLFDKPKNKGEMENK